MSGDTVRSLIEQRAAQSPDRVYALAVSVDDGQRVPIDGSSIDGTRAKVAEISFGELARSCRSFGAYFERYGAA